MVCMAMDQHDQAVTRCPRIGDFVPFKYCRTSGDPFCWVIVNCWAAKLDIGQFLADHYEAEVIHQGLKRPESGRVKRMLEVSEQYRKK